MGPLIQNAVTTAVMENLELRSGEIRRFIVENFLFGQSSGQYAFADDDSFLDRGIIDSTGILELVAFLEERYGIAIADEEMTIDNFDSVVRVARFVGMKRPN